MAKPTISEVLDRLEKNEQRNAALFSGIIDRLGELSEAVKPKAENAVLKTEAPIKDEPIIVEALKEDNVVTGKIKRLAWHKAGLLLEGNSTWFNAEKGSKLFESFQIGDSVSLVKDGDLVTAVGYYADGAPVTAPAPKEKAVPADAPKAVEAAEGRCSHCGGNHRHIKAVAVQMECLALQAELAGYKVSWNDLDSIEMLVAWVKKFCPEFAGKKGIEMEAAGAASASQTEEKKAEAPKEQGQRRRFSGRRSNGAPKEKELEASVTGGTYKGFINRIGQNPETAHMVRIVSTEHQGPKGEGVWFSASKELLAGRSVGDRVSFVLDGRDKNLGKLIGLTLLGSVEKDTGHRAGVKNSGKQDAPASRPQPKDEIVASGKEGAAAKAAKVAERRSRMAAANKQQSAA